MALTKLNFTGQPTLPSASMPTGSVLQTVSNTFTTPDTFHNETADSGLACAITPRESNSLLMITASLHYGIYGNGTYAFITDSSNNVIQQPPSNGNRGRTHFGTHYGSDSNMTYNTIRSSHTVFVTHTGTSAQTFKVRVIADVSATFYINRNKYNGNRAEDPQGICTMIIQEIKQ